MRLKCEQKQNYVHETITSEKAGFNKQQRSKMVESVESSTYVRTSHE